LIPELSIVVVNWNSGPLLRRCLESVRRHPPALPFEVIVVDNASSDESLDAARGDADRIIENDGNAGFGRACNQAFAASSAPLAFLLNPDAEVFPGSIDTLIATLHAHPKAGACGPRLLNADGSLQPSVWRNPPVAWHILVSGLGLWRLIPRARRGPLLWGDHWAHDEQRPVPMIFGAAMLVRRSMIDDVGGFDERFPLYEEDSEWCLRMRRRGWTIVFEPRATVLHHGGACSLQRWSRLGRVHAQQEAFILFQRVALSRPQRTANLLAQCIVSAGQTVRHPSDGAPRVVLKTHLRALTREVQPS
jgi:N-acetylglucosaminyl-diphospho-decaprenol L-rhamnosyltransferase